MSPEQASGKPADARSNIFSFGVVLYEVLSGARAFAEETAISTMAAVLHKEPPPLREIAPHVPAELEAIVTRCLAKNPAARFPAMADVRHALDHAANAPGTQPRGPPSRSCRSPTSAPTRRTNTSATVSPRKS